MGRILRESRGATLVEMLVGISIMVLLLFAAADIEISAWRLQVQDEDRYMKQSHASLVADRFAADVRQAVAVVLVDGADRVQFTLPTGQVTYHFDAARGEVIRQSAASSMVAGREIGALAFYREAGSRAIRIEVTAGLRDGSTYRVITRAVPRS